VGDNPICKGTAGPGKPGQGGLGIDDLIPVATVLCHETEIFD